MEGDSAVHDEKRDAVAFEACESWLGTDRPVIPTDGEGPRRTAALVGYSIDRYAVSVERFAAFAKATRYETEAERIGWSYVFRGLIDDPEKVDIIGEADGTAWWLGVNGASWRNPTGNGESALPDHPVTHISWHDAATFAEWVGGRLPNELEWEHAARGGTDNIRYPWGDEEPDDETIFCNIWQGRFPDVNTVRDGYVGTAPIDAFGPNAAGLYNMAGNVWEWTADRFRVRSLKSAAKKRNAEAQRHGERIVKGGSFLCHASYCWRYRIAARSGRPPDSSSSNSGFRLVYSA
ncbi:MAG: formylglycine-generating enzyme family protein [Geminicoccaceae bacterium]